MKALGILLISVGFVAGSYFLVVDGKAVNWTGYAPCFLVGIVGVALARIASRQTKTSAKVISINLDHLMQSIGQVVENITELDTKKASYDVYDLSQEIDKRFLEDLTTFVDSRESISHAYGLQEYAAVMNSFAAAERHLNRVWSCSVDGYIDEAHEYITRAKEEFVQARDTLNELKMRPQTG